MNEDVRAFLKRFSAEELADRGVLSPDPRFDYLLNHRSVSPLIRLMGEQGISKLEATDRNWYLTSEYEFSNPSSSEQKSGNAKELTKIGNIFNEQNKHINPFFRSLVTQDNSDDGQNYTQASSTDSGEIQFGLERDLQRALRDNIKQLEPGLKIIDDGFERTVDAGRIDITAEDDDGQLVVIELKAGTAPPDAIPQLLAYMGTIENPDGKPIRGILVAKEFHPRVVQAAQAVPNLFLKAYSFQFTFKDR